jgi:hypothetical protein
MSLNVDCGKYDLLAEDQAIYAASWALYWLSDALWAPHCGAAVFSRDKEAAEAAVAANEMAISAMESKTWPVDWMWPDKGIVGAIESILKGN